MERKLAREAASFGTLPRDRADENGPATKTFTEDEHLAILADRVSKETASLTEQVGAKDAEIADLKSKFDVAEAGRIAAEQAKADLEQKIADEAAEAERKATAAALAEERKKAVADIAGEDFCTAERVERWSAMDQANFDATVEEFKAAFGSKPDGTPRESAAFSGKAPAAPAGTSSSSALIGALRN